MAISSRRKHRESAALEARDYDKGLIDSFSSALMTVLALEDAPKLRASDQPSELPWIKQVMREELRSQFADELADQLALTSDPRGIWKKVVTAGSLAQLADDLSCIDRQSAYG